MTRSINYVLGFVFVAVLAALGLWGFRAGQSEAEHEKEAEESIHAPSSVKRSPDGTILITLDLATQERIALKTTALSAVTLRPHMIAIGALQEDPSCRHTLRAPLTGTLHAAPNRNWPNVGEHIANAEVVGLISPRFGPMDRVDLMARLSTAKADVKEDEAELLAARASFENKKRLNTENKIVSDRTLEEVEAKVKAWEARLDSARENVQMLEASLTEASGTSRPLPLAIEGGGDVADVLAEPGESVESGQALMRVQRFDKLLARVELPAGQYIEPVAMRLPAGNESQPCRLAILGDEENALAAEFVGVAPDVDLKTRGQGLILRVTPGERTLRPGMAVQAFIPRTTDVRNGVTIPRDAIVRFGGAAWVYVQSTGDGFIRKEAPLNEPTPEGWFVDKGFQPNDRVVTAGAQILLSEELKSQFESEAE
ncbi:MAG: HlyD family efflux transporter periplasmic adaptor subunit [Planctomycetes bacterium]|nr:HlyD family efflux transporter periplasmic adaptor subunit [Planctomycetota bacterium]